MKSHYSRFLVTGLLALFMWTFLFAQKSSINYDLSDYKLPYLKRHVLEFNFNLGGSYGNDKSQYDDLDPSTSINRSYSANINPRYYFYLNSKKFQVESNFALSVPGRVYSSQSSNISSSVNESNSFEPTLSFYGEFKEYVAGKFFLEQDLSVYASYDNNSSNYKLSNTDEGIDFSNKEDETGHSLSPELIILAGWGRIERVEDARLAVYILDDLNKAGQLSREVSEEDISLLAERISEVQNERFFDSRHKKIWELQQIDSLLTEMGLIESANIYYYALLNDNWDYANGPVRNAGFSISGGISSNFHHNRNYTESEENDYITDTTAYSETESKNREIGVGPVLKINYEKPINLYWQFSLNNTLGFSREFTKSEYRNDFDYDDNYKNSIVSNQFYAGFGYFPNSRTAIHMGLSESYNFMHYIFENENKTKYHTINSSMQLDIEYYLSPKLRLFVNSSIYQRMTSSKNSYSETDRRSFDCDLHASLIYKIL